jgi:hypothetical protein
MKKQVKIAQNLSLDKETIAKLDENQLKEIAGGGSMSCNAQALEDGQDDENILSILCDVHSCCNASCNG